VPRAFEFAIRAIDNLIEQRSSHSTRVFINTTVTRGNVDRLQETVALAREHGVDGMTMSILNQVEKYSPDAETAVQHSDTNGFSARLRKIAADSGGLIPHSQGYLDGFSTYLENPNDLYKYRCVAGFSTAVVHPDGEVHACPVAFAPMGHLRVKSFPEIWFSDQANEVRERIKANQHPICWFDCIAPLSVFAHDLRHLRIGSLLDRRTLGHMLRKAAG
jgi:MoaA/NifB/PqqE/SkfB family radical SAM enzyme